MTVPLRDKEIYRKVSGQPAPRTNMTITHITRESWEQAWYNWAEKGHWSKMNLVEIGKKHSCYVGKNETLEDLKKDLKQTKRTLKDYPDHSLYKNLQIRAKKLKAVIKEAL